MFFLRRGDEFVVKHENNKIVLAFNLEQATENVISYQISDKIVIGNRYLKEYKEGDKFNKNGERSPTLNFLSKTNINQRWDEFRPTNTVRLGHSSQK